MMTVGRGKKGIWDGKEGDSRRGKEGYADESEGGGGRRSPQIFERASGPLEIGESLILTAPSHIKFVTES